MRVFLITAMLLYSAFFVTDGLAQYPPPTAAIPQSALKSVLQRYLMGPFGEKNQNARYYPALANLKNGQRPQIVVYITGPHWCGAGGCTLLILSPKDSSYQVISKTIGVELPVQVLPTKTSGWHDLGVWSEEGAKRLTFNGRKYPINAYSFPSRRMSGKPAGDLAIPPTAQGVPLYD